MRPAVLVRTVGLGAVALAGCTLLAAVDEHGMPQGGDAGSVDAAGDGDRPDTTPPDPVPPDAGPPDVGSVADAACTWRDPFGPPQPVPGVNSADDDWGALHGSELVAFVARANRSDSSVSDLYQARRTSLGGAFADAEALDELNTAEGAEIDPTAPDDHLEIVFSAFGRPDAAPGYRLWRASRLFVSRPFGPPALLGVSVPFDGGPDDGDYSPFITPDGRWLLFASTATGAADLYQAERGDGGFGPPTPVPGVNTTAAQEAYPVLSADGLDLYFTSNRDNPRVWTIWLAHRPGLGAPFEVVRRLDELVDQLSTYDNAGSISRDNCRLYFSTGRGGNADLWVASRRRDGG